MASWNILEIQEKVYSDYNFKKTNISFYGIIDLNGGLCHETKCRSRL